MGESVRFPLIGELKMIYQVAAGFRVIGIPILFALEKRTYYYYYFFLSIWLCFLLSKH
jgi:hypothetical protein